jgi:release factor glutamine methyltransferase
MQLGQALQQGWERLEAEAVPSARLAAEVLLMHALGCARARLYAHPEQELGEQELQRYAGYVRERAGGKPTQYITGRQEFWGLEFRVTPDALIPRPETEHVVERAAELCRGGAPIIIDVGTGSGCIAIALAHELPRARVFGTDISEGALRVAAENARRLAPHVRLCRCDLLAAIADGVADLVVCNPPYVPHSAAAGLQREIRDFEPPEAVFAGPEGMEFYARLLPEAARVLRPGGWVVLELGYNTADRVRALLDGCWDQVEVRPDLAGIPRALSAKRIMS